MSDLLLELYSEEIPPALQEGAKSQISQNFKTFFDKNGFKDVTSEVYSTPKRLIFYFDKLPKKIEIEAKKIKGPKVGSPEQAISGFKRSNNLGDSDLFEEDTDKGRFYFANINKSEKLFEEEFRKNVQSILSVSWKKSMRWCDFSLFWGRPLKSILCLFDGSLLPFDFFHLQSKNHTYVDGPYEDKSIIVKNFKNYVSLLEKKNIVFKNVKRLDFVRKDILSLLKKNSCEEFIHERLLQEVVNLVETPTIVKGYFDKEFLKLPDELLILTMQTHQRYFPMRSVITGKLLNSFIVVTNNVDTEKKIVKGNEKVLAARFYDADFFYKKNKGENLVKQVGKLKKITFYQGLGTVYDKSQRLRIMAGFVGELLSAKRSDCEVAGSICKADLVSDLVKEFPELQGVLGKYFALAQGFTEDIAIAIEDHYQPVGPNDKVPKEKISVAVAISEKIDNLVGFFGINEKPTSSSDPYALRRSALGLLRIIIEDKLTLSLRELLNTSKNSYFSQGVVFSNLKFTDDILDFLLERFRNLLKDQNIRAEIIEAVVDSKRVDNVLSIYQKIKSLHKFMKMQEGKDIIEVYKRAKNILSEFEKDLDKTIFGNPETVLFNSPEETALLEKINAIREHLTTPARFRSDDETLKILAESKDIVDKFFDNVKVNDDNDQIKKNRVELLFLLRKTFDSFCNFSKFES